jgi:hypothetical protein
MCAVTMGREPLTDALTWCQRARDLDLDPVSRRRLESVVRQAEADLADARLVVEPPKAHDAPTTTYLQLAADRRPTAAGMGQLSVQARRWGSVLVNGRLIANETPLLAKPLPAGTYQVQVCFEGDRDDCSPPHTVVVQAGRRTGVLF